MKDELYYVGRHRETGELVRVIGSDGSWSVLIGDEVKVSDCEYRIQVSTMTHAKQEALEHAIELTDPFGTKDPSIEGNRLVTVTRFDGIRKVEEEVMIKCECLIHRYHVAHLCACGEVISHSQGDFDSHKHHGGMIGFHPDLYEHGDGFTDVWERLGREGKLPTDSREFEVVRAVAMEIKVSK